VLKVLFPNNSKKVYNAALNAYKNKTRFNDVVDGRNVFARYIDLYGGYISITIGR